MCRYCISEASHHDTDKLKKMKIQLLRIEDLPAIADLQPDGWADIATKFLEYCSLDFCTPVKAIFKTEIVGIGALIKHEQSAWLGHIIVDQQYRGRGIGKQIVQELMQLAETNNVKSINLIATALGMPVYQKAGFRNISNYHFFRKVRSVYQGDISENIIPAQQKYYAEILTLDRKVTGENRAKLITNHLDKAVVFLANASVEGYYLPTLGQGPIYARTDHAGIQLMKLKIQHAENAILPEQNTVAIDFLLQNGFEKQETTAIRMTYGAETVWQPKQVFHRIGGNYG